MDLMTKEAVRDTLSSWIGRVLVAGQGTAVRLFATEASLLTRVGSISEPTAGGGIANWTVAAKLYFAVEDVDVAPSLRRIEHGLREDPRLGSDGPVFRLQRVDRSLRHDFNAPDERYPWVMELRFKAS